MPVTKPCEFVGFGDIHGPKPHEFIVFGAMDVTKPYEFMGFGAMDVTKPCEFIGFGAMDGPKLYEFIRFFNTWVFLYMGFLIHGCWLPGLTSPPPLPSPPQPPLNNYLRFKSPSIII